MTQPVSEQHNQIRNRLLASLPNDEFGRLLPKLEQVPLDFGASIYNLGDTYDHVYFPTSGIISLLAAVDEGATLEVGVIGNEGMAGLPLFMRVNTSHSKALVQGQGTAMRMTAGDFQKACGNGATLTDIMLRFSHSMLTQVSQSAVCYRFHDIEKRLARWLLMTSDRMETNEFRMTQDFLSNMLGVRREAVNSAAGLLQKKDLLSYSRGYILIVDRPGLEAASCKCYSIISDEEASY